MRFRRTGRTGQSSPSSRPDPSPEPISQVLKDLLEELQSRREPKRPPRDWIQIIATALPGLAALIALIFTWQSINATTDATNRQLQVAGQGQVTDRYNAAITNLDSSSVDVRLGGIYALQRIMQDSPRDQPAVVTGSARRPSRGGRREPAGDLNAVEVREWARAQGIEVKDRGRVPADLIVKFRAATS